MRTDDGGRGTSGAVTARTAVAVDEEREGALATFRREVGELWPFVSDRCRALDTDEMTALSQELEQHLADCPGAAERVLELTNDLMALLAGWDHYDPEGRRVLAGAMGYVAWMDDAVPDDQPGGLDDDDLVVRAAVRALVRTRRGRP